MDSTWPNAYGGRAAALAWQVQDPPAIVYETFERVFETDGEVGSPSTADGATHERLFNPFELANQVARLGFDVRVAAYWGGANGRRLVRLANTVLAAGSRLTIYTARAFRIAAEKHQADKAVASSRTPGCNQLFRISAYRTSLRS